MVKVVTGSGCVISAECDSEAAGWEQDAVRPNRRTDLTDRNRSSILCFLDLDIQVRTTRRISCGANLLPARPIITEALLKPLTRRITCFFPFISSHVENMAIVRRTVIKTAANSFIRSLIERNICPLSYRGHVSEAGVVLWQITSCLGFGVALQS